MDDIKDGAAGERITFRAELTSPQGRTLDPQNHDHDAARAIAAEMCEALTEAYQTQGHVRPETLAIAVQTVLETLLGGIQREGVDTTTMRVALANSVLSNGDARVSIDVKAVTGDEVREAQPQKAAEASSNEGLVAGRRQKTAASANRDVDLAVLEAMPAGMTLH